MIFVAPRRQAWNLTSASSNILNEHGPTREKYLQRPIVIDHFKLRKCDPLFFWQLRKIGHHPKAIKGSVVGPRCPPVIGQPGQTQRFYRSDFSHPISHRTPHYRVENGVIGWIAISQKRLNFGRKRDCKVQDNMGGNGLGSRCSNQKRIRGAFCQPTT
jgi:hypothetical protein